MWRVRDRERGWARRGSITIVRYERLVVAFQHSDPPAPSRVVRNPVVADRDRPLARKTCRTQPTSAMKRKCRNLH